MTKSLRNATNYPPQSPIYQCVIQMAISLAKRYWEYIDTKVCYCYDQSSKLHLLRIGELPLSNNEKGCDGGKKEIC